MSARTRRKHLEKAVTLLPADGFVPLDYALGGAGSVPPAQLRWLLVGGWIFCTTVATLLLQTFVAVGAIPMLAIFFAANKPRGVMLSDRGLASFRCGFFNGRPTDLLSVGPLTSLDQRVDAKGSSTKLQIGDDAVWLSNTDLGRFLHAAPRPGGPAPPPAF